MWIPVYLGASVLLQVKSRSGEIFRSWCQIYSNSYQLKAAPASLAALEQPKDLKDAYCHTFSHNSAIISLHVRSFEININCILSL
jgi:hypothetical protein